MSLGAALGGAKRTFTSGRGSKEPHTSVNSCLQPVTPPPGVRAQPVANRGGGKGVYCRRRHAEPVSTASL